MAILSGHTLNHAAGQTLESAIDIEETVEHLFTFHPYDQEQEKQSKLVVEALKKAAKVILSTVPPSADRSAAIRKLREVRMDCNSAIAHRGMY